MRAYDRAMINGGEENMRNLIEKRIVGCGRPYEMARASAPRDTSPDASAAEMDELVAGNNAFAFSLYQAVREGQEGNFIYSPYSISLAAAMVYAGARGETEQQMADTLHFTLPQERLHPAFNALGLELASRGADPGFFRSGDFELTIANAVWGQRGYPFREDYLDILARDYDAGVNLVDFQNESGAVPGIGNSGRCRISPFNWKEARLWESSARTARERARFCRSWQGSCGRLGETAM